jgi:hypothetical protein
VSKSTAFIRHPYRSGLAVRVAIQEVNDVSILFCNHGANRCRAVSTGGLAALAVKVFRKNRAGEVLPNSDERKNQDVDQHD